MNLIKLCELFSSITGEKIYSINFPEFENGAFTKLEITTGVSEKGGVYDFNIQFMSKAKHPAESEEKALNIINKLDGITNRLFGNGAYQLILIKATSPQPFFEGIAKTENTDDYVFSCDFRVLVARI